MWRREHGGQGREPRGQRSPATAPTPRAVPYGPAAGGPASHATQERRVVARVAAILARYPHVGLGAELAAIRALPGLGPAALGDEAVRVVVGSRAIATADGTASSGKIKG